MGCIREMIFWVMIHSKLEGMMWIPNTFTLMTLLTGSFCMILILDIKLTHSKPKCDLVWSIRSNQTVIIKMIPIITLQALMFLKCPQCKHTSCNLVWKSYSICVHPHVHHKLCSLYTKCCDSHKLSVKMQVFGEDTRVEMFTFVFFNYFVLLCQANQWPHTRPLGWERETGRGAVRHFDYFYLLCEWQA